MAAVGRYELLERIDAGGTTERWRARSDGADEEVAVELLAEARDLPEADLAAFDRDCRLAEELQHPHWSPVLDHGVDPDRGPWLATALVRGMTLRDLFGRRRSCPEAALVLLAPVLEALAALHDRGLVHREVRPTRVIVSPLGDVTLVGFGLPIDATGGAAVAIDEPSDSRRYRAPEWLEGRDVDPTTDVWAMGVLIYELIAGRAPFERASPEEEREATLAARFTPLSELDPRVGPQLDWLVGVCLAREPWDRPKHAKAVLDRVTPLVPAARRDLRDERISVLSDPDGYCRRVAPRVVPAMIAEAEDALRAGDSAEANRRLDRARAYAPEDPAVRELAERVAASSASMRSAFAARSSSPRELDVDGSPSGLPARDAAPRSRSSESASWRRPGVLVFFASLVAIVGIAAAVLSARTEAPAEVSDRAPVEDSVAASRADAGLPDAGSAALSLIPLRLDRLSNADPPALDGVARADGEPLLPPAFSGLADPESALARAERALAADPDDVSARVERALSWLSLERDTEGLRALDRLSRQHPDHPDVQAALGLVRMRQGRFDEADAFLSAALRERPDDTTTRRRRGVLRHRMGRTRAAYRDLEQVLREDPDEIHALTEITQIYQRADRVRDAAPLVRRILRHRPEDAEAWASLSIALAGAREPGSQDEAVRAIERALELAPDDEGNLRQRCVLFAALERPGAVPACGAAIRAAPRDPDLFMARARELSRLGQHVPALADADRAVELAPDVATLYFDRHRLRERAGLAQPAVRDLMHACQLGHVRSCTQLRADGLIP